MVEDKNLCSSKNHDIIKLKSQVYRRKLNPAKVKTCHILGTMEKLQLKSISLNDEICFESMRIWTKCQNEKYV